MVMNIGGLYEKLHVSLGGSLREDSSLWSDGLRKNESGVNPDDYVASVPQGVSLNPNSVEFLAKEKIGMSSLGKVGFVLVAGGLGERLGYSGIKLELPSESTTGTSYLELYIKQILAIQRRYCTNEMVSRYGMSHVQTPYLPLAIMTSDDTHARTEEFLKSNDYFGMDTQQITLLKQEKVASLKNSKAHIALMGGKDTEDGKYIIDTKPYGSGDIHAVMYSTNTAYRWSTELGTEWILFFQDTNGLGMLSLPSLLGHSVENDLIMNSAAVPRYAEQAIGAITTLTNVKTGGRMTVNIEYNQLKALLANDQNPHSDVADPETGYSRFPGNINHVIFSMKGYLDTLYTTSRHISEIVNPEYKGEEGPDSKEFNKPTRLECMMQDYPKALESQPGSGLSARVGYTQYPAWAVFSPCQNNAEDSQGEIRKGLPARCAWNAESDQYYVQAQILRNIGVHCPPGPMVSFRGITACAGPQIVIKASTAIFITEIKKVFPFPSQVRISKTSSLVLSGDIIVEELDLDGALDINAAPGTRIIVRAYSIANSGHRRQKTDTWGAYLNPTKHQTNYKEKDTMRGFVVDRQEEEVVTTKGMNGDVPAAISPLESTAATTDTGGNGEETKDELERGSGSGSLNRSTVYYWTGHALIPASMYDDSSKQSGLCSHCAFAKCCCCSHCA